MYIAHCGGIEVADWTVDREIRVWFLEYSCPVCSLMARRPKTSSDFLGPCQGMLGKLKTPSCPWLWVPGSRSKFGNCTSFRSLYSWNIAKCAVKPKPTDKPSYSYLNLILVLHNYGAMLSCIIIIVTVVLSANNIWLGIQYYPTSGKILGMWLAKRNQILCCIRLPIILMDGILF